MRQYWTPEDDSALKALYPHFLSGAVSKEELCAAFNRTMEAISNRALRLGFTRKPVMTLNLDLIASIQKRLGTKDIDVDAFRKHMKGK